MLAFWQRPICRVDNPGVTNVRRIAHLDMDAFFASVELLRYPH